MGERLRAELSELKASHPIVGEVRGKGLLIGVELAVPGTTDPLAIDKVNSVIAAAQERGVLLGKNSATVPRLECVLTLSPPLVITADEVDRIVTALDGALGTVHA
jgi:taurine-pyruvate aminotransferase